MEIFQYDFMVRALIAGVIMAFIAPLLGIFLVVRNYALLPDTLAHVSLAGIAIGILTQNSPVLVAIILAVMVAFILEKLREGGKYLNEAALALFLWAGLAIAVVLIGLAKEFKSGLLNYLFGSLTTVTREDIYFMMALAILVTAFVYFFYKELFVISFDNDLAQINGINTRFFNRTLVVLAAVTVVLAMRIVGIMLVGALMVIPVISAIQFKLGFKNTIFISIFISLVSVVSGLFFSYYFDLVSGGAIVITAVFFYMASYSFKSLRS